MTLSNPRTVAVALLLAGLLVGSGPSRGNALVVDYQLLNEEGAHSHVIPRGTQDVRMVAERVVLVPYWDSRTGRHVRPEHKGECRRAVRHSPAGPKAARGLQLPDLLGSAGAALDVAALPGMDGVGTPP